MIETLSQNYSVERQVLAGNEQKWPSRSSILAIFYSFNSSAWMNYFHVIEYQLVLPEYIHIEQFLVHMTGKDDQISSKILKIGQN